MAEGEEVSPGYELDPMQVVEGQHSKVCAPAPLGGKKHVRNPDGWRKKHV